MMNGFVKLNRKILESAIFCDADILRLWIYLLCRAVCTEQDAIINDVVVHLKRGQLVCGRKKLAMELGAKDTTVYAHMKKLEKLGSIAIESRSKFSIITIVNWEKYQLETSDFTESIQTADQQQTDNRMTADRQQNDSRMTADRQQNDTYKEREEIKEREKREEGEEIKTHTRESFGIHKNIFLTREEYNKLKHDFWEVDRKIDNLSTHIAKTGKTYPSHYNTLCEWLTKDGCARCRGLEDSFDVDDFLRVALEHSKKTTDHLVFS